MSVKRIATVAVASIILLGFIGYGIHDAVKTNDKLEFQDVQLNSRTTEIKDLKLKQERLNLELDKAAQEKNISEEQYKKLEQEAEELKKKELEYKAQLQSKLDQKNKIALAAAKVNNAGAQNAYAATSIDCRNQTTDKAFIYCHESGNTPTSVNQIGACGLGQALPCSKLPCSLSDYACQDNWFTNNYMIPRYGSWANAKAFWMSHGQACKNDVGWCGWW